MARYIVARVSITSPMWAIIDTQGWRTISATPYTCWGDAKRDADILNGPE